MSLLLTFGLSPLLEKEEVLLLGGIMAFIAVRLWQVTLTTWKSIKGSLCSKRIQA